MGARRESTTAVVAVLGAVLAIAFLGTWAASIGPGDVLTGDGPATHRASPSESPTPSDSGSPTARRTDAEGQRPEPSGDHPVVRALLTVGEVALAALWLYLMYRLLRWLWERWTLRRRPDPRPAEVAFDVLEVAHRVAEEIHRDAARQRELLLGGSPRNAIVECWHRFEQQAETAGLPRKQWETSSEFTLRMLDLVSANSPAVERLAVLYREARFSDHPVGEHDRAAALADLDAIHAALDSALSGSSGGSSGGGP
ncbi:MAG TPA: DUF4129 domain-containing protein [Nocardioides sp.]|nr:DUF4129 domain-containing protein [Nocardioides sp.]